MLLGTWSGFSFWVHKTNLTNPSLVLLEQLPRSTHYLSGDQRVQNDPAGLAPDEGDIGEVEAANLNKCLGSLHRNRNCYSILTDGAV